MISGLRGYAKLKDSGVQWIGDLPDHWKVQRAQWLFRKMSRPVSDTDEVVTCFRDGTVTLRKNRRMRGFTESLKEIGYQGIRRGDLVIHAMDAFAGAIGVADSDGKGTPVYAVCEPGPMADAHYYAHAVREMARSQWIQALAKGVRERSTDFRFEAFRQQHLPLPPLPEQAAIVRFLDHADRRIRRYIRAKQKLIKLLEEQKQAIIHRAVTRGLDPDVRLKPSGVEWLGDVPEHWEVAPFKRRVGFREGPGIMAADFRQEGTPLLRINSLRGSVATLEGCNFLDPEAVARRWSHFAVRGGEYLLSASASTGRVSRAGPEVVGAIPYTGMIRLWPCSPRTHMPFAVFFISSGAFQDQINLAKSGVGIEHFGPTHLKRMSIVLPPKAEQAAIAEYLEGRLAPMEARVGTAGRQIALAREYRARLIADVVTGKVDVREAAARLPEESGGDPDDDSEAFDDDLDPDASSNLNAAHEERVQA